MKMKYELQIYVVTFCLNSSQKTQPTNQETGFLLKILNRRFLQCFFSSSSHVIVSLATTSTSAHLSQVSSSLHSRLRFALIFSLVSNDKDDKTFFFTWHFMFFNKALKISEFKFDDFCFFCVTFKNQPKQSQRNH